MRVDLHVHSSASDGTTAPAEVVRRARAGGLDVVALTDHDTLAGHPPAAAAVPAGLTLVPGAEISCAAVVAGRRISVHLLAYLFDPAEPALAAELERLRTDRDRRGRAMVARLRELGAPVRWEDVLAIAGAAPVGRPHVAEALVRAGVVATSAEAFTDDWIGAGGRAHVPKHALEPTAALALVHAAGGVGVLAHPRSGRQEQQLPDEEIARLATEGLGGVEVDHPEHDEPTRARLRSLAGDLALLVTGGSDYHGDRKETVIGAECTAPDQYDALLARAHGATPLAARG